MMSVIIVWASANLMQPRLQRNGDEADDSAWAKLVTQPLADAAAMWGARGRATPREEATLGVDAPAVPRDLPLTRSGVSDVMGAIGLA